MRHLAPPLIAACLCLSASATLLAQDTKRQILTPDQLPTIKTWKDPVKWAQSLQQHLVRLRVTPYQDPRIRTLGDPFLYGIATLVRDTKTGKQALITGEFFVRDAQKIEIIRPKAPPLPVTLVRIDRNLGLASLIINEDLQTLLKPAPLRSQPLQGWDNFHVLVFDINHRATLIPVKLQGQGEGAMAFYKQASPGLGEGHPIFDDKGQCIGLFAIQDMARASVGYVLMTSPLREFLNKDLHPDNKKKDLSFEVLGGTKTLSPDR